MGGYTHRMTTSVIVAGARTPIGRFNGSLAGFRAVDLGAIAIREALARAGVAPDAVEYTIMGHVLQAGQGQITARQAAVAAGIPIETPAITINKVCLSGTSAVAMADQMIRAGELEVVVAGGMESMTNARSCCPRLEPARGWGTLRARRDDPRRPVVRVRRPAHGGGHRCDQRRARPHPRGTGRHGRRVHTPVPTTPWEAGRLADEVVAVDVPQHGATRQLERDEGIRADTTVEGLASLRQAFTDDGTVTASNASQISTARRRSS